MFFGIHPKSIYKKGKTRSSYIKHIDNDEDVLSQIRLIVAARPSYGYKRVTALLNRQRVLIGLEKYNKKRIYRIMKNNGLLLPKVDKVRVHQKTGKIMTMFSNTRWCSDCFEVKCFNGEKVYVIFVLDCCDREVISFFASKSPLLGEDVQSIMINAVEKRFGKLRTDREIEFLSDRGAIYRSYNVQALGKTLGLKSCYTAPYSPESNGMSEALVKTIKRDYVYMNDCDTGDNVIAMLGNWFDDYNRNAPHSALGMKSPLEYGVQIVNW